MLGTATRHTLPASCSRLPSSHAPRRPTCEEAVAVKRGSRLRPDSAHRAGGSPAGTRDGRARRREEDLPARMVSMETGAPGCRRPLPKGESSRQRPRPQRISSSRGSRRAEYHDALRRGSTAHRRRLGARGASLAAQAAQYGAAVPRPPDRVLGGILWVARTGSSLAGDARRVRQVGDCLQALRVVVKAGLVATYPRSAGRRRVARTGDQRR
jgi:hypothetical protein